MAQDAPLVESTEEVGQTDSAHPFKSGEFSGRPTMRQYLRFEREKLWSYACLLNCAVMIVTSLM